MSDDLSRLCALADLPDPGGRAFSWGEVAWPLEFFVVRKGHNAYAYVNRCPHAGHELNWQPDRFLTSEGDLILCQSHGARFTISEGLCILGPCPGASLIPVELVERDGDLFANVQQLDALLKQHGA